MSDLDTTTPTGDVMCAGGPPVAATRTVPLLFPPRDADAEARRAWIAASPWPEVVFASAGAG